MTRPHSDDPSRRTVLQTTGAALTASLLPDWLPFVDEDALTVEERLDRLEESALRFGALEDRPEPGNGFGEERYLADDRVLYEVVDDAWEPRIRFDDPETAIGSMFFIDNTAETTFDAVDEWTAISGESTAGELRTFSHDPIANTLTYDGDFEVLRRVAISMVAVGDENNAEYELATFNNGEFVDTRKPFAVDAGEIEHIPLNNLISLDPGEELYPALRCTTGTDPLTVQSMSMTMY